MLSFLLFMIRSFLVLDLRYRLDVVILIEFDFVPGLGFMVVNIRELLLLLLELLVTEGGNQLFILILFNF